MPTAEAPKPVNAEHDSLMQTAAMLRSSIAAREKVVAASQDFHLITQQERSRLAAVEARAEEIVAAHKAASKG